MDRHTTNGKVFNTSIPGLPPGEYCFAFNPDEEPGETEVRLVRTFTIDQQPSGEITTPASDGLVVSGTPLVLAAAYTDDDPGEVKWAVRPGNGDCRGDNLAGNVGDFEGTPTPFTWTDTTNGKVFNTSIPGLPPGEYCFAFNPDEEPGETEVRLVRTFTIEPRADLRVRKGDRPDPVIAGENLTYLIEVRNLGPSDNAGFTLVDELPAGTTFVSASPGCVLNTRTVTCTQASGLTASSSVVWNIVVTVDPGFDPDTRLSNTAAIRRNPTPDPVDRNNSATTVTNVDASADLEVRKTDGASTVIAGEDVTYRLRVKNLGPSDNAGFTLVDELPAGTTFVSASAGCVLNTRTVTCSQASGLTASSSVVWNIVVTVDPGFDPDTRLRNTAAIRRNATPDPVDRNNTNSAAADVDASADLRVRKGDRPDPVIAGENLTYLIEVRNLGPSDNAGFTLVDELPAGTTFVSASPGCVLNTRTVTCTQASGLTASSSVVWNIVVTVDPGFDPDTRLSNTAAIRRNPTPDPVNRNNSATTVTNVDASADLEVRKTDGASTVIAGEDVTYRLRVKNLGPSDNAGFTLVDESPAGTTFVSASAGCVLNTRTVTCSQASGLTASSSVVWNIVVTVDPGFDPDTRLRNTAAIRRNATPDPVDRNNTNSAAADVDASADLRVRKTDGASTVIAGEDVTYRLRVKNLGPSDNAGFTLVDELPAGTTFVSASAGCVLNTRTVTCSQASGLTASSSVVWNIVVTVDPGFDPDTRLSNTAAIRRNATPDPVDRNNTNSAAADVDASADLRITKTDSVDPVTAGNNLTYRLRVRNFGPSDAARGIAVTDTLPPGTTFLRVNGDGWTCRHDSGEVICVLDAGTLAADTTAPVIRIVVRVHPDHTGDLTNTATVQSRTTDPNHRNNTATETTEVVRPPRSIGHWKQNCTPALPPQTLGEWSPEDCHDAVDILGKRSTDGHNRASDGAYKLASQLLAAKLNLASDAETCPAVLRAVNAGNGLLTKIGFDGTGDYLGPRTSMRNERKHAIKLAEVLDEYNNGNLCGR